MPREIETEGPGRLRALFVSAGNPVLSCPDGDALERALETLDLCVSIDLYVNETNRHADYVLPAATFYERDDLPLAFLGFYTTPFVQYTDEVVPPAGEAREEWEVIDAISRRIGIAPYSAHELRRLGELGIRLKPKQILSLLLRTGPGGDLYGLRRGGLNLKKLLKAPSGIVTEPHIPTGVLREKVRHPDHRVRLDPPQILSELQRIRTADGAGPEFPLLLIGLRELRSHNSWMHNAPLLMRGGREHAARINAADADEHGLVDGGRVRIHSNAGSLEVGVKVTDEMTPGTVALPHGWGHRGGWQVANAAGGANSNLLASAAPEDLEPLAGMAFLNGIPVRLEPVGVTEEAARDQTVGVSA